MSTNQTRQSDRTLLSLRGPRFVRLHVRARLFFLGRNKSRRSVIEIYDVTTATTMDHGMILNFLKTRTPSVIIRGKLIRQGGGDVE